MLLAFKYAGFGLRDHAPSGTLCAPDGRGDPPVASSGCNFYSELEMGEFGKLR